MRTGERYTDRSEVYGQERAREIHGQERCTRTGVKHTERRGMEMFGQHRQERDASRIEESGQTTERQEKTSPKQVGMNRTELNEGKVKGLNDSDS